MSHKWTDATVGVSGRTAVGVEQPAQSLTMANPASVHCGRRAVDDLVVQSLMIAFVMVMLERGGVSGAAADVDIAHVLMLKMPVKS